MSAHRSIAGLSDLPGQFEIPGAGRDMRATLQRRATAPLRGGKPQAACDVGLFGDTAAQTDLIDMLQRSPK